MTLRLERLESRDQPSYVYGWLPSNPVRGGTQASDVIQNQSGTCSFLAACAALAAKPNDDIAQRLRHVSAFGYDVQLHDPGSGALRTVRVSFNGYTTPDDPECRGGEFWPVLFQRAYLKLVPSALRQGDSLDRAEFVLTGHVPTDIDVPRHSDVFAALASEQIVLTQSVDHAEAVTGANKFGVALYNPWGFIHFVFWQSFYHNYYGIVESGV